MGEILAESEKHKGGRPADNRSHDVTGLIPKLADVGIEKTESHRYQQIASVPEVAVSTASDMLNNHDWCLVRWNNHRINK